VRNSRFSSGSASSSSKDDISERSKYLNRVSVIEKRCMKFKRVDRETWVPWISRRVTLFDRTRGPTQDMSQMGLLGTLIKERFVVDKESP